MDAVTHLFLDHPERAFLLQLLSDTLDGAALERRISALSDAILAGVPAAEPEAAPKTAVARFL